MESCQKMKSFAGNMSQCDVLTLTWGDVCENGPGMQKIGNLSDGGYSVEELEGFKSGFEEVGCKCEMFELNDMLKDVVIEGVDISKVEVGKVLVIREGMKMLLGENSMDDMWKEQIGLNVDKKVFMRGKVKNKLARYNLCFGEVAQDPNYEEKKGRVYSYDSLKCLNEIRNNMEKFFGKSSLELKCEGNYYYDLKKCGIGFHGDGERKKVIGMRMGKSMLLSYGWFYKFYNVGGVMNIELNNGDMYVMSEKSVGFDWKRSSILTLRHAGGVLGSKYLKYKVKVEEEEKKDDFSKEKEVIKVLLRDMNKKEKMKLLKELFMEVKKEK